ncbi:anoctamin-10 isoform X4 [Chironomus tepperi]|uniref:anoctamin-10 isoform X4 n=1 Tax=Chironomus tepperi TaxID=113505 RepID=UPI00391F4021
MHNSSKSMIPSMEQRKSQINLLNFMDQEKQRRDSKEFLFPDDNLLHKRRPSAHDQSGTQSEDDESAGSFESYMVIEFDKNIKRDALHWIIDKIRMRKSDGGAQLLIRREPCQSKEKGLIIHISATKLRLLDLADEIGFTKPTRNGMRNFNIGCLDDFLFDNMTMVDILTPADKQFVIKYALENIKAQADERQLPGYAAVSLYHGQSIIHAAMSEELIVSMFTLHDKEFMKRLGTEWWNLRKMFHNQPIEKIRKYFGDAIGFYFSFVGFYTSALVIPTILGIVQFLFGDGETTPYFCCFYVVWMTVFLEIWKRKCSAMAYRWGTLSLATIELPRPDYYGKLGRDPITGKLTPQYPQWKTMTQVYLISVPVILLCIGGAAFMTISQFWVEDYLIEKFGYESYITMIPSIFQSIFVAILTVFYDRFATYLTVKENHRTQNQYERHRVNKLIVLEFVNNFFCLFYIAFVKQDMKMLQNQLMTQMLILQFVQNAQEFLLPKLKQKYVLWFCCDGGIFNKHNDDNEIDTKRLTEVYDDLNIQQLDDDDPRIKQNIRESAKDEYNTYDDYLELYIQFGYVVLFSSVAPFAAFWALFNNFFEIRLDAYKLCKTFRRPFARRAKNTGAWQLAFEVLACLSIMSNCGILYLSPQVREITDGMSTELKLIIIVALEHFLLLLAWIIHKAIPDRPSWVRIALARNDYESKQALKRESVQRTKNVLFRRFKSFHPK